MFVFTPPRFFITCCLTGLLILWLPQAANAQSTIHVPSEQAVTIQAGIDLAQDGDTVLVAPGQYHEAINLLGKAITVRSEHGPSVTTIDSSTFPRTNTINCVSGEGSLTLIDGFTITGGVSDEAPGVDFAGIRIFGSGPSITNCVLTGNDVGILIEGGGPTVRSCVFDANNNRGVQLYGGQLVISNSQFSLTPIGIFATWADGPPFVEIGGCSFAHHAAAIFSQSATVDISDSTFMNNVSPAGGAAITKFGGVCNIQRCTFSHNVALGGPNGGAIRTEFGTLNISHSSFLMNYALMGGRRLFRTQQPSHLRIHLPREPVRV
jgi:predicted outer membrane repeat protein